MREYIYTADMLAGDEIEGFYLLSAASVKTTSAGKPFLSGALSDKTGSIELKMWDFSGPVYPDDIGRVVKIEGTVTEFRGSLQLTLSNLRFAGDYDSYDISELVPTAPIDAEERFNEVCELVESIEDEDYKKLARTMLERNKAEFMNIPAAKKVHHGFINGLLMHTSNMLRTADFLAGLYAEVIDRSLLLTATLLHDFAKAEEFSFSELGMVKGYTVKGDLLGHLVMGAANVERTARELGLPEEKTVLLQHMILSHHGEPEHGAAVKPLFAEAELLHFIDMIDSRMEIYAETLPNVPAGEFSDNIFALEKRIFNHG